MAFTISIIAIAAFLSIAALGVLAIVVAGIRSDDHARNLTSAPRTRTEAVTRRVLGVGVRSAEPGPAAARPPAAPSSRSLAESDLP